MSQTHKPLKVVFVGNKSCGKTTLGLRLSTGQVPTEYIPTVFDNIQVTKDSLHATKPSLVAFWDTVENGDYMARRLRPLAYPGTNVFVIVINVMDPNALELVESDWLPEIEHHSGYTHPKKNTRPPILIVGTKIDLRSDGSQSISTEQALEFCNKRDLVYIELSSKTGDCCDELMDAIIDAGWAHLDRKPFTATARRAMFAEQDAAERVRNIDDDDDGDRSGKGKKSKMTRLLKLLVRA